MFKPVSLSVFAALVLRGAAAPVINEVMFHPPGVPENVAQEWIEIFNPDAAAVDVSGWKFSKGVSFTIPAATTIPAGGYLVVAADVAAFTAAHPGFPGFPGFPGTLVGGWTGQLSDSGEVLELDNATGVKVSVVTYGDDGEWALRGRGVLSFSHNGWDWFNDADGGGKTIELRSPALAGIDCGQNWGVGGSPGAANSVASVNVAPLIKGAKHRPEIPHSTDPIVVSCNLHDEAAGAVATLNWRLDGAPTFNPLPMTDTDGDGDVEATIPAQANLAIVEWFISATDGTNTRTWPAPARTSDPGVLPETFGQVTNALVLVDNSYDANATFQAAGNQPIYRLIMTAAEKAELLQIQTNSAQDQSDAAMNATFISHDGTGVKVRYLAGLRNRGTGSRLGPPNNYHVSFRNDDLWEDRSSMQINCRYPHSQVLGALCFGLAGIAQQESAVVRIRVNGVDLADSDVRMYGRYVRNETMGGAWAKRHFPNDPDGNVYFLDDHNTGGTNPPGDLGSGEFRYEGTDPDAYSDTYKKKTNEEINDYSDLITLTDKLTNTPDATFAATIPQYFDLDQFYTFIATDALIGNQEGGLQSGRADDAGLYRGVVDPRFRLIPHDFDSVFSFGLNAQDPGGPGGGGAVAPPVPTSRSIFSYDGEDPKTGTDGVLGLHRLFTNPELVPRYYAKVLEQMDKWFNHATLDPAIDRLFGKVGVDNWVAATGTNVSIASAKAYIDLRRANILTQIQQTPAFTATGNAADVNGMKQTTDGSATFSGTFNVAKTYSITVNGTLATMFYRTAGADAAGTWKLVTAAGSGFLKRGINRVTVNFYDGTNGTGDVLTTLTANIYFSGGAQTLIGSNGVAGSVGLIAPASYVPGVPVMVRVDLKNAAGAYDRTAWNTTVTLTATGGVTLTPNTVTLYNGVGSALVAASGVANFTLTAATNGLSASKALTSLNGVAQTSVSGTLAGANSWSGIVHVTGDVTVPTGASLAIQPGTHVLIDGTTTAGSTTGKKISVTGTGALSAPGTLALPISITSFDPTARWGQISVSASTLTALDFCLISHASHAPTLGHTNKAPIFLVTGSSLTLRDCVVGESPGKAMFTAGTTGITLQRSLILHTITGPELQDGTSLLCEDTNIQEILPTFRESNDLVPDDEDCLYIHNAPGRSVIVRRCAFAMCGDDVIDNLAGPITVEDSILRQGWDKGISLLNNDLTISGTQIIDCDKGIALKSNAATTHGVTMDHCTISSQEHDSTIAPWGYPVAPAAGDPDAPATGIWTQNKAGQSNTSAVLNYNVTNSIIEAKIPVNVDAPYPAANSHLSYTCTHDTDTAGAFAWPGVGNIEAVPLFVDTANKDFHLLAASPCVNSGDPAAAQKDMGALPLGNASLTNIVWTAAASPFRITADVTIATGRTLTIEPGVTVYADENKHILVNGSVRIAGTATQHVALSGVPGLALKADPADPGLPLTTPKWGGLWLENSNDPNNLISYVDFVDAQDPLPANRGCIELKQSACTVDHCTFRGTHLHMIYGDHCSITCQFCEFPDEFPGTDVPGALNNVAEQFKLVNKFLPGGHCLVRWNVFHGNKGHNDVLDVDSDVVPNPILQVRENIFLGQNGDEDCDLGGDVFLDGNIFAHGHKDTPNTSAGHASAFSTGDAGTGTTVVASRNIFWDVDHATTLKSGTATIFEHNTCYSLRANFVDSGGRTDVAGAISFLVPAEGSPPGDGAYCAENIFRTIPQVFGDADRGTNGVGTFPTRLQFDLNIVDPATPTAVGSLHPLGLYSLGTGNIIADAKLTNPANGDFALAADSLARGAGFFGDDLGALIPAGARIKGEPPAQTPSTSATLTVGGPGIFYYKWKLDGGAWSAPIAIDPANPLKFPRTGPTKRTAQLALTGLDNGPHTVSVVGQDFGGQWQEDAAATVSKTWTVDTALQLIRLNEVLADSATLPDTIELYNAGAAGVDVSGWSLTDDLLTPAKYVFPAATTIPAGGYLTVTSATSAINLDKDGDAVYLYNGTTLVDSVVFGHQIPDFTIGRTGQDSAWALCVPTLGAANVPKALGLASTVRINEWFTSGAARYDNDWIELANSGALPVALGGLRLTDNIPGDPAASIIAPLSFIAANGFVKFIADGTPSLGATHLSFALDAQQEEIALLSATGAPLDLITFYPQTTDYSQGRDAAGNYVFYELPTAGLLNGTTDPAYANALALLRGLRITEIMYNPLGGTEYEYVELRNVGTSSFDLAGVKFVSGIDFTFPSTILSPGQNILVVKNFVKFRNRYGNGPLVAGTFTGSLDNSGEKVALQLPPPFDANVLTFTYSDAWQPSTDGPGRSLIVPNPLLTAGLWGNRETWAASSTNGGDPNGAAVPVLGLYADWSVVNGVPTVTADGDFDGIAGLVEFALGMNPASGLGLDGAAGAPGVAVNAGHVQLRFLAPANAAATQMHGMPELTYTVLASSDLVMWSAIATKTFPTAWSGTASVTVGTASGGFTPVVVEDSAGSTPRFLRLQVTWTP